MYGPMTFADTVETWLSDIANFSDLIFCTISVPEEALWESRAHIGSTHRPKGY